MPGQGVTSSTSQRNALTVIAKWMRKLSVQTTQKYALLTQLQRKNRIVYGCSGGEHRWVVQKKDHDLTGHVDGAAKQFSRKKNIVNANLPWRGYESDDVITLLEKLEAGGEETMVKILGSGRMQMIKDGLTRRLGHEFFKDGNAAGNETSFHGLESMFSMTGQTAADELATTLNDSYAGLSTAYGSVGGTSDATKAEYKVWSPVVVNCNRTPPGGTVRNWEDYADEYIRLGIIEAAYGNGAEDQIDLILLTKTAYRQFLNIADDKERIHIVKGKDAEMVSLGFKNAVELDGVSILWDFGIPATDAAGDTVYGYGLNTDRMKLNILGGKKRKTLFGARVDWNTDFAADRMYFWLLGNMCFESPRHFVKFAAIS